MSLSLFIFWGGYAYVFKDSLQFKIAVVSVLLCLTDRHRNSLVAVMTGGKDILVHVSKHTPEG